MNTGMYQRRWSETRPAEYDKQTRYVCMDIKEETQMVQEDGSEEMVEKQGYSYIQVQVFPPFDYGNIKSQLIENGFGQKDEFGLLMNAVDEIVVAVQQASSWSAFKEGLDTEDVEKFKDFCEFRAMCAAAAKVVMRAYQ